MNIAKAIRDLRISQNISQENLAAKLFVSRNLVSKWETGVRRPDWRMIEKIAECFGVSPNVIANRNELLYKELEKCLPENSRLSVEELVPILNTFLFQLNEEQANLFICRYYFFDDISHIASSFHLRENHVRTILSRTRDKLQKYIKENSNGQRNNV